jgi:flagellar hook protein FlgE
MFTAISSLTLHQSFMDVVADNLANANTHGFKASRVAFQDQFGQLINVGTAPTAELGGVDPTQIGLGVRLGSVTTLFTQGMLQSTGRSTDLAIQGDGFFIYSEGAEQFYSRDGATEVDAAGYLVNSSTGMRLQGWQGVTSGSSSSVDTGLPIGDIQLPIGSTVARATANIVLGGNLDSTSANGTTQDITVGVYDSLGTLNSLTVTFTKTGDNAWDWSTSGSGATGSGAISFTPQGQYDTSSGAITFTGANGAASGSIALNLGQLTQLAAETSAAVTSQDGIAAGSLTSFYVAPKTGEVFGLYSNGLKQLVGQLALASFVNPSGLIRHGQNVFKEGLNSGAPGIGTASTGGRGTLASGYLEASNVDLAQEFTNMILAQRGFQASSRVITTSDEMLQELVNIKR